MIWKNLTVLLATVKPILMIRIICKQIVVPNCPLCNSQAHPYDPDKSDRPLCNKVASQGKKGQKATSGMYQYETLMYKCISFI